MSLPTYINIHTHQIDNNASDTMSIVNKYENFDSLNNQELYSLGIHPWYIDDVAEQMTALRKHTVSKQVVAIGECGLDKVRGADFKMQQHVFLQQVILANELNKPLLIHCVRAYDETLRILEQASVPVIFHGFNKKKTIADKVLEHGHYISFGAALLSSTTVRDVFSDIPLTQCFLETDDTGISIKTIYSESATIRNTGEDAIILQLEENFKTVFKQ